jgi:hypothetical protein
MCPSLDWLGVDYHISWTNFWGADQPPEPTEYPQIREKVEVPFPNVAHPGDRSWGDKWSEEMVSGILCNPVYAGIGPYPEVLPESEWKRTALVQIGQIGVKQFLVNMLYALKRSFGAPGQPNVIPPYGYGEQHTEE